MSSNRGLERTPFGDTSEIEPVHVLIVDDQPENLISMEALLSAPDTRLILARSGKEALRAVLEYDFALILLDVQMPIMDGFETAEIIRKRERSRHTPIIFVTAINKSERNIFQGYSFGAVDYIFKPFMPEILKSKVDAFVELYRKTAEIRKQKEYLERVNQELEIYSQTMASDLRNTLHRVTSLVDLIRNRLLETQGDRVVDLVGALDDDSQKIRLLFSSLLDFSQTINREFSIKSLSLTRICSETITVVENETIPSRRVKWIVSDLPEVLGDDSMIRMVFRNLLSNAVRFTKQSNSPMIEIGSYQEEDATVIFIKDNGSRLDMTGEEDFSGAFKRLGSREEFEGTGISLAVAQRIVRKHGGRIWAHPEAGLGSTIYFTLPTASTKHRGKSKAR